MTKSTMTYHNIPLEDFYNHRVDITRVTYMFLMTDGLDEDKQCRAKKVLLPQWGKRFGNQNVFGFYVMLHETAKDSGIDKVIDNQKHLWKVQTADVNINLVRLQEKAIYNVKNDKFFDLPIYGDLKDMKLNASFPGTCPYKVSRVECKGKNLRIWVDAKGKDKLPTSSNNILRIELKGCSPYDFLVTEQIDVLCENKPERSLIISVRDE